MSVSVVSLKQKQNLDVKCASSSTTITSCVSSSSPHFCVKTHASTHAFKSRCRSVTVMSRIYGSIYLRQSPVNMTTFWFLSADISARGCFFILVESTIRRKGEKRRFFSATHSGIRGAAGCTFAAVFPHTAGCICPSCVFPFHTVRPVKCQVSRTPAQVCVCTVCMYVWWWWWFFFCELRDEEFPAVAFSPLIVMITGWPSHSA